MYDERDFIYEEEDWKLFIDKIAMWQERHMQRLNEEYISILSKNDNASSKFWEIEKRINKDKNHPGVKISRRRSSMFDNIFFLYKDNIIDDTDLEGFSELLIKDLKELLVIYKRNMGIE